MPSPKSVDAENVDGMEEAREAANMGEMARKVMPFVQTFVERECEQASALIEQGCDEGADSNTMLGYCHRLTAARKFSRGLMHSIVEGADAEKDIRDMVQRAAREAAVPTHVKH